MCLLCSLFLAKDVSFQVQNIKRTLQICFSTAHAGSVWRQEVKDACQVLLFVHDLSERMSKDVSERMSDDCFQSVREVESNRTHFRR